MEGPPDWRAFGSSFDKLGLVTSGQMAVFLSIARRRRRREWPHESAAGKA